MLRRMIGLATGAVALALFGQGAYAEISSQPFDWKDADLVALDGTPLPSDLFEGKVVLVVNTASRCGFTPQYAGLQDLWERYRDQGLVVLGIPSNDFGGQEPGSNEEIAGFCERRFKISFPMTEKAPVTGSAAHPVFVWANRVSGGKASPQWNFYKLLVGRDGTLAAWFTSMTTPQSTAVTQRIEEALTRGAEDHR